MTDGGPWENIDVNRLLRSECDPSAVDVDNLYFSNPRLSNIQMAKQIYGFSYGRFAPTEPPSGNYFPQNPEDWYLWKHTGKNTYYQWDPTRTGQNKWVNLGPTLSSVPPGASAIQLKNSFTGGLQYLSILISRDNDNAPILMTDQGFMVKKDIQAGGFLASSQGALWLGSGLTCQADPPMIMLANSNVQGILGGGYLDIPSVPGGWPFPSSPSGGQLWYRTDAYNGNPANTLYRYNSYTTSWDVMGPKSDFEGYFDTLYLVTIEGYKPDDSTLANMRLKKLIASEAHINDYYSKTGGNATFHGDVTGNANYATTAGSCSTATNATNASYATTAGSSSSASAIPVLSSDPSSPATGSIWLKT